MAFNKKLNNNNKFNIRIKRNLGMVQSEYSYNENECTNTNWGGVLLIVHFKLSMGTMLED